MKTIILSMFCLVASATSCLAAEGPLSGHVRKETPRIARPLSGAVDTAGKGAAVPAAVDENEFRLSGNAATEAPLQTGVTTAVPIAPMTVYPTATTLRASVKANPVAPTAASTTEDESMSEAEKERLRNKGKTVMVRLTGFDESMELTPEVNQNAFRTAIALQEIGVQVTMYLDQRAVRFVSQHHPAFVVDNNPVDFHKLMARFIALHGKVLVDAGYAKKIGVPDNGSESIKFGDDADIARAIAANQKIMDFTSPLFPALYTGPVSCKSIWHTGPEQSCTLKSAHGKHSGTVADPGESILGNSAGK